MLGAASPPRGVGATRLGARPQRASGWHIVGLLPHDRTEVSMAYIRITQPPNVTADTYERVNAELNAQGDPPPGMLLHCAGEVDGKWQIVDVWESEDQARQFYEGRLTKAIEAVMGMTPPEAPSTAYELHTVIRP
jgi:hypothetical protein